MLELYRCCVVQRAAQGGWQETKVLRVMRSNAIQLLNQHYLRICVLFSIEYKATVPISGDKMAALEEVPVLPKNTSVFLIGA